MNQLCEKYKKQLKEKQEKIKNQDAKIKKKKINIINK